MQEVQRLTHLEAECDTATEFMDLLQNASRQSGSTRGHSWMWRGIGNSEKHKLLASALRPECWLELINARNLDVQGGGSWSPERKPESSDRVFLEWASISLFYRHANQQALPLPPVASELHGLLIRRADDALIDFPRESFVGTSWLPRDLWPVIALAQHYGVRTRLLDWSRNPLIAAYFAARSSMDKGSDQKTANARLGVWRADAGFFDGTQKFSPPRMTQITDPKCRIHVVDAPYSGNPNLAAQGGRFTLVEIDEDHEHLKAETPLDEVVKYIRDCVKGSNTAQMFAGSETFIPLLKLSLPTDHSAELMELLHTSGIDASRIFPGFQGCAEAIREAAMVKALR